MKVYIAGPYTQGDVGQNVKNAIEAGMKVLLAGHIPYVPHLSHFMHMIYPQTKEVWMEYDEEWLKECEALIHLPGKSVGAAQEEAKARALGLPIFKSAEDFLGLGKKERKEEDFSTGSPYRKLFEKKD